MFKQILLLGLVATSLCSAASEYLIKLSSDKEAVAHLQIKQHVRDNIYVAALDRQKIQQAMQSGIIQYSEPNYFYRLQRNNYVEPKSQKQWGFFNLQRLLFRQKRMLDIKLPEALQALTHSQPITVAIIDSGIDIHHRDLQANIWVNEAELNGVVGVDDDHNGYVDDIHGFNFITRTPLKGDPDGHGTHCAGTIGAAYNNYGIGGIMPQVRLMGLTFSNSEGGDTAKAIEAIYYAVDNGAKVINASWGGGGNSKLLKEAIEYALQHGVMFITAAGNYGHDNDKIPFYPASFELDNIISVGAMNRKGMVQAGTNYGQKSVTIFAPGEKIYSTLPNNSYAAEDGTSMATPFVTGVVGLMNSISDQLTPVEIKEKIISSATPVKSLQQACQAAGLLNALAAIKNL